MVFFANPLTMSGIIFFSEYYYLQVRIEAPIDTDVHFPGQRRRNTSFNFICSQIEFSLKISIDETLDK